MIISRLRGSGYARSFDVSGGEIVSNPRYSNGSFRRKVRARFAAQGAPCSICGGRLGPIRYDQPSDPAHPLSLVVDEIRPVSRWREFGYDSPRAAAQDLENLAPAHRVCNAAKGDKVGFSLRGSAARAPTVPDGEW